MADGSVKLALAGDTMLGRMVAEAIRKHGPESVLEPQVFEVAHEADLFVLNLECCVSERGSPWPDPFKPFFFRAPPAAVEALQLLGVDCVTLANNHALDYGAEALLDTLELLRAAGIGTVGAGVDLAAARAPATIEAHGYRLGVVGVTDHPEGFAATVNGPGVAFAPLDEGVPRWLAGTVHDLSSRVDGVLVTPHWGPNMNPEPLPPIREAAAALVATGATLVAGHSAHVFQGVAGRILYDLGDFLDDYRVDPRLRNDLGLLFLVTLGPRGAEQLEAVPLALDYCRTRLAAGDDLEWIERRFRHACAALGTVVERDDGRLIVSLHEPGVDA